MTETFEIELEFEHPQGDDVLVAVVEVRASHDYGYWSNANGDGCPPSSDYDWKLMYLVDGDGNKYEELPDWIGWGDLDSKTEEYIENL